MEALLERGGELDLSTFPATTVELRGPLLIAYGLTEVPPKSRLQAAYALADAVARAELLSAVRVGVASLQRETLSSAGGREAQEIESITAQATRGLLPALPAPGHAWQLVERDGERVLRVWSRLAAPRAEVEKAVAAALPGPTAEEQARRAVARMASAKALPAPTR